MLLTYASSSLVAVSVPVATVAVVPAVLLVPVVGALAFLAAFSGAFSR